MFIKHPLKTQKSIFSWRDFDYAKCVFRLQSLSLVDSAQFCGLDFYLGLIQQSSLFF